MKSAKRKLGAEQKSAKIVVLPSDRSVDRGEPHILSDLLNLTKPKVMVLLLISTGCPMVLAGGGVVNWMQMFWTILGGALVSGSASAMNCIWERESDALMERTKNRPIAAGRLSPSSALVFSLFIGFLGLTILCLHGNHLAAGIALFGHLFYVLVYTIWLKPRTPQNIVIGGAAGAVPPLVGWAVVAGSLNVTALLIFLVIFLWTPPHFWALALNKNADYRRAGIPMLPVVAGERATHVQMFWYAVSLVPVSLLLVFTDDFLGWFSFLMFGTLGVVFAFKNFQLMRSTEGTEARVKKAWDVFSFSLLYLGLFFVTLVVDSALI